MTIDTKYDGKIHDNLCAAIKSLSPENKFAFAPIMTVEEHKLIIEASIHEDLKDEFKSFMIQKDVGNIDKLAIFTPDKASVCKQIGESICEDGIKHINFMQNIVQRVADQVSDCGHFTELSSSFLRFENYGEVNYRFHRDSVGSASDIRLSLALKGKGTAFTVDQPHYNHDYSSKQNQKLLVDTPPISGGIVSTPDLHLAVFTSGDGNFFETTYGGTIHSAPKYEQSELDSFSRIALITSFKPIDAIVQE